MQQKIRINDLARELEVKSKAIIDALDVIGITEKKTHSSSLENDEAAKIRAHFGVPGGGDSPSKSSKPTNPDELKPKFDLSHISRPGDVLKAILQKQQAAAPGAPMRPVATPPSARSVVAPPVAKPAASAAPSAPVAPVAPVTKPTVAAAPAPGPRTILPQTGPRPVFQPRAIPPSAVVRPPAPVVVPPVAPAPVAAAPVTPVVSPELPARPVSAILPDVSVVATSATPAAPAALVADVVQPERAVVVPAAAAPSTVPGRRLIVPQTGPRPVYTAPVRPVVTPRPVPGKPIPGRPIFERPRPGAGGAPGAPGSPGSRPLRPGERRPTHPTRTHPTGPRPGGPGVGLPTSGPPPPGASRPGARPMRGRPGQNRYPKTKEGPMKGFIPPSRNSAITEAQPITRAIVISEGVSVKDLAEKLSIRAKDLIARLVARGVFATVNQTLDASLATEMANFFGADTSVISFEEQAEHELIEAELAGEINPTEATTRPPVVTVMGHVDHGKTTLLDSIRHATVAEAEAGGITQHIGAYKVKIADPESPANGREIVFLDTPGHQAFTRMRARGAKATDIVVVVVAADDGVMPQTLEAIDHANAAEVPIIVAVNKIDKEGAMPDRVKKQLGDRGLVPEEWGGNTVFVDVSAKKKTNLNLLMEMICLVADLKSLKAVANRPATGVVLEAKLDRGRGPVATVLVQQGTLKTGDNFVVGNVYGKVRAMFDDRGHALEAAPPSTPVEILGMDSLPQAGDQFVVMAEREKARAIAEYREQKSREAELAKSSRVTLEGLAEQIKTAGIKDLPIILKGDVQGSVEVIRDLLQRTSNDQVRIKVLRASVGAITESDVVLAAASNAVVIGFNVRPERKAAELAEQDKVDVRLHTIIYELQDEIKRAMIGLLDPTIKETYLGRADVKETFRIPKVGTVAGCQVADGTIRRDSEVRLVRDNVVVFTGKILALKRFKDDASEVRSGMECGISIQNYGDIRAGDTIEAFSSERVAGELRS